MTRRVLDASALLAYLQNEPGSAAVEEALGEGVIINSVNWTEVLTRVAESTSQEVQAVSHDLRRRGLAGSLLRIVDFTEDDAIAAAALRPPTRRSGLSLADRACLATAQRLAIPAMTTDRVWAGLTVGVTITVIR